MSYLDNLSTSTPEEPFSTSNIFATISSVKTISGLKREILNTLTSFGFSDFFFTTTNSESKVITTLPSEIYSSYFENRNTKTNLILSHSTLATAPVFMSSIVNYINQSPVYLSEFNRFYQFACKLEQYEISDFYAITNTHDNCNLLFIIMNKGAPPDQFQKQIEAGGPLIRLIVETISVLSLEIFPEFFLGESPKFESSLKRKPLQLITLLAKGNITLKDAAAKMQISLDTANKHVASAKKYFGVNTITGTIYQAIKRGLIDFKDDLDSRV